MRARDPLRQRHLLASLAEGGQQTPIIVVQTNDRYLVIDGHKRIAALQQLGRDTVDVEGYVSVHSIRYSVPVDWIGRRVQVRETRDKLVMELDGESKLRPGGMFCCGCRARRIGAHAAPRVGSGFPGKSLSAMKSAV